MDEIVDFEARLDRAEQILTKVAAGDLTYNIDMGDTDDRLSSLEMGINFMIIDLRATVKVNSEQERALRAQAEDLSAKLRKIDQQEAAIRQLSTPVIEIWDDVLALPIIGVLDAERSLALMNGLLESIVRTQSRNVLLDLTGVEVVDTRSADSLLKVVRAARLLGARCILTGLSPAIAETLVRIGADLAEVTTLRSLREGLQLCLQQDGARE